MFTAENYKISPSEQTGFFPYAGSRNMKIILKNLIKVNRYELEIAII